MVKLLTETLLNNNKLIVPTSKGLSFIPQEEVLHLEVDEGYTKIHLADNTQILSSYNLGKFEKSLGRTFFKCHKSHIVNIEKVRSFENEGYVVLENGHRVPRYKSNRKIFLSLFKKNNSNKSFFTHYLLLMIPSQIFTIFQSLHS